MSTLAFDLAEAPPKAVAGLPVFGRAFANRRGLATLILTLVFWLSNFVIIGSRRAIEGDGFWDSAASRTALTIFGLGLCYIIHASLTLISPKTFVKRAVTVAILAVLAAEAYAWASYYALVAVDPSKVRDTINWSVAIYTVASWTWFFLAWAGLYVALEYSFTVAEERARVSELQAHAYAAKISALHNQISPHFLFNSLNSISALILDGRQAEAERTIAGLSEFFRVTLALNPFEDIALEQEIDLQRSYLTVEQIRYPDLEVEIDLPPELRCAAVPALILQPIIENAVKYGVQSSIPPARISLRATSRDGFLTIEVTDSGNAAEGCVRKSLGIGLSNVRQRLAQRYCDEQALEAGKSARGFTVRMTLPLERIS